MSRRKAPTSARTANPTNYAPDRDGGRRGLFSCVLWQTSRLWRRPSARRLAIGRNKGTAARRQGTIADSEAGRVVRLSRQLGKPEPPNPKNCCRAPHPFTAWDSLIPCASRSRSRIPEYRPSQNMRGDFQLPIFGRRAKV